MSASEVLERIATGGARITAEGGELVLEADQRLPAELVDAVRQHKAELLALLKAQTRDVAVTGELTPSLTRAVAMTKEAFSQPPKPQPNDGLSPDARETLGVIRKIAARGEILDALAVADAMRVSVTALSGALVALEGKRLIQPGDWSRCGTRIKLVTH